MATMVLVHGGWSGGFVWERLVPELEELGHTAVAIEQMPSAGGDPAALGGLEDDVELLRSVLDDAGSDVVLVGHSSGGIAVGEVADHPAVTRTVYVAAFLPPRGTSMFDLIGDSGPLDWQVVRDDGAIAIIDDVDVAHRGIAHDIPREEFETYFERYGLQSIPAFATPTAAPDRTHPVTYVVCADDQIVPGGAQEQMAAGVGAVIDRLPSSHCPMLSMPGRLAEVLHRAAAGDGEVAGA